MSYGKNIHQVDADIRKSGNLAIGIGMILVLASADLIIFAAAPFPGILLFTGGSLAIVYGAKLVGTPTVRATVQIDETGISVSCGKRSMNIPWPTVGGWGLASRRAFGRTSRFSQLVIWPADRHEIEQLGTTERHPLWNAHHNGWVLTTYEPTAELLADLERHAPMARTDRIAAQP